MFDLANKFKLTTLAMAYRFSASAVELYCGKNTKMQFGVHPKILGPPFDLNIGPFWVANQQPDEDLIKSSTATIAFWGVPKSRQQLRQSLHGQLHSKLGFFRSRFKGVKRQKPWCCNACTGCHMLRTGVDWSPRF